MPAIAENLVWVCDVLPAIADDLVLGVTRNLVELVRVLVGFVEDVLRVLGVWPDAGALLAGALTAVLEAQLQHCLAALRHPVLKEKVPPPTLYYIYIYIYIYI